MAKLKIATITLNPAIDTLYKLEQFLIGNATRTKNPVRTAGGKGLNVTRVVKLLGEDAVATGFIGGYSGQFIRSELKKMGVHDQFIEINEESRQCLAFVDNMDNQTEILPEGPFVTAEEQKIFKKRLIEILSNLDILIISGSLPRGVSAELYQFILMEAKKRQLKVLLDTSGQTLWECLSERPYMIKPNREELEQLLHKPLKSEKDIWDAIEILHRKGIPLVIVSDGRNGSFVIYEQKRYKVTAAKVQTVSAVGSGDAFVAGIAVGLARKLPIEETLILASACGAANALEEKTGFVNKERVNDLIKQIQITEGQ
ncbi:1-phosphofructokinase [Bacillus sp. V3-13]|uniref:1-phosphofructokinase n=1 Tax=Bacillus sp. V3-13 TaxID=2053728 RepID=UPI000C792E67|nr:1-phosphofructokinase [Bacillus sp. V3-13]PLR75228.1 1-phosphofructokinase [Bacillus sp. V3-13]